MNKEIVVSDILKDLGISASLLGYHYIKEAILILNGDATKVKGITKRLYPEIAKLYGTTATKVERAMRNAVETGWLKGNVETQKRLFGYTVKVDRTFPTNSEFIATVVDWLVMNDEL